MLSEGIEAVILVGGLGTRLREKTENKVPKPMVDVAGLPFLHRLVGFICSRGITRVIFAAGHLASVISRYEWSKYFPEIEFEFVVEKQKLGTGGAAKFASSKVEGEYFFLLNGDTLLDVSYRKMFAARSQADITIAALNVERNDRYGEIEATENGDVVFLARGSIKAKPTINAGVYLVRKSVLSEFEKDVFSMENDVFLDKGELILKAYSVSGYFIDIGIPSDLERADNDVVKGIFP